MKFNLSHLLIALCIAIFHLGSKAQSKMIVGKQYSVFVDIPKNWIISKHKELPLFLKPAKQAVADQTYMYVYGIDYNKSPNINNWIIENTKYVQQQFKDTKAIPLKKVFNNLKANNNCTGKYKIIQYNYTSGKREAILAIECKQSVVTAVLSAASDAEFNKLLPAFYNMCSEIKVLAPLKADAP